MQTRSRTDTRPPFERVVTTHGPALLRFLAMEVGPGAADDCFQETMLAALRSYDDLRDPGAVGSWLFSIAARKAVDAHRVAARAPRAVEDTAALAGAKEHEQEHRDEALWERVRTRSRGSSD